MRYTGVVVVCGVLAGCNNAGSGALTGAGIGALSGLALGSLTGDAGKGAAAGAVIGGLGGGLIGDQNRRREEEIQRRRAETDQYYQQRYQEPAMTEAERGRLQVQERADRDRVSLLLFEGGWEMSGWVELDSGEQVRLRGEASGFVQDSYFVVLEIKGLADGRTGQEITGTFDLASEPGLGVTLTTRFSTWPTPTRFAGETSDDGRLIRLRPLKLAEVPRPTTEIEIRFVGADTFTADVTRVEGGERRVAERYTFTRR
jgi:outer membrane lipoprotein SlyB